MAPNEQGIYFFLLRENLVFQAFLLGKCVVQHTFLKTSGQKETS
jgi:hypothetical protein